MTRKQKASLQGAPEKASAPKKAKLKSTRKFLKKGKLTEEVGARKSHLRVTQAMRKRDKVRDRRRVDGDDTEDKNDVIAEKDRRAAARAATEFAEFDSDESESVISGDSASDGDGDGDAASAFSDDIDDVGRPRDDRKPIDSDDDDYYNEVGDATESDDGSEDGKGRSAAFDVAAFDADVAACATSLPALRRVVLLLRVSSGMLAAAGRTQASSDVGSSSKERAARLAAVKGAAILGEDLGHAKAVAVATASAVPAALWRHLGLSGTLPAAATRATVPTVDVTSETWRALHVSTAVTCASILRLISSDVATGEALVVLGAVPHLVPLLLALASSPKPGASRTGRGKVTDAALHSAAERTVRRWGHALVRLMTHSEPKTRVLALVGVLDLTWGFGSVGNAVDILYKAVYLSVIRASRLSARSEVARIVQFLMAAVTELWGLDLVAAYTHGFTFLRQLAGTVRQAVTKPSPESRRRVCSWQFVNALRALQVVVCKYPRHDQLYPLTYPLTQIAQSVLDLFPLISWAPLHLQLVSILNGLAAAGRVVDTTTISLPQPKTFSAPPAKRQSGAGEPIVREAGSGVKGGGDGRNQFGRTLATPLFIPVASYLLRILSSPTLRQPKKEQATPKDLRTLLRLKKETQLRAVGVQRFIVGEAMQLLLEHFALNGMSIAFPEIACSTIAALRALRSEMVASATAVKETREAVDDKNRQRRRDSRDKARDTGRGTQYIMPGPVRKHVQSLAVLMRTLVDNLERNSAWIMTRRQGVRFGPRDVADVLTWEAATLSDEPPIVAVYTLSLKRRSEAEAEAHARGSRKRSRGADAKGKKGFVEGDSDSDDDSDGGDDGSDDESDDGSGSDAGILKGVASDDEGSDGNDDEGSESDEDGIPAAARVMGMGGKPQQQQQQRGGKPQGRPQKGGKPPQGSRGKPNGAKGGRGQHGGKRRN